MMNLDTQMMIGVGCFAVAGGWLSRIQRRRTASQDFLSRSDSEPRHLVTGCAPPSTPPVVLPASTLLIAASCYVKFCADAAGYHTLLAKLIWTIDRVLYVLFGLRMVVFHWGWMGEAAGWAERTPLLVKTFGPQDSFREALSALQHDWRDGAPFARIIGLLAHVQLIHRSLAARKAVMDYIVANPEVVKNPVRRPLILIGLPRTGTTILHRLLSLDPANRCLRNYECLDPLPPPQRETHQTDPRIAAAWGRWAMLHWLVPGYFKELWKFHYFHPGEVEEETLILPGSMLFTGPAPYGTGPSFEGFESRYENWYMTKGNKAHCYRYLRAFLQVLGHHYGPSEFLRSYAPPPLGFAVLIFVGCAVLLSGSA